VEGAEVGIAISPQDAQRRRDGAAAFLELWLFVPMVTARHPVAFPAVHRVQEGGSF